jgi:hypothetical protein
MLFGIEMDKSAEHFKKAFDSIRQSFDGVSKMISWRVRHPEKQLAESVSMDFGSQIEESAEQGQKTSDPI